MFCHACGCALNANREEVARDEDPCDYLRFNDREMVAVDGADYAG